MEVCVHCQTGLAASRNDVLPIRSLDKILWTAAALQSRMSGQLAASSVIELSSST